MWYFSETLSQNKTVQRTGGGGQKQSTAGGVQVSCKTRAILTGEASGFCTQYMRHSLDNTHMCTRTLYTTYAKIS